VLASYDPDPDYFFHWYRDSAVVIESLRLLLLDGSVGDEAHARFAEFVRFGLSLRKLDGRDLVAAPGYRERVIPTFRQYLRGEADLSQAQGDRVFGETRVNPDGTLDISTWARPQHDGPPLTALALLGWLRGVRLDDAVRASAAELLRAHLDFTQAHWHEPSFDIWEEEKGLHYYTLRVSAAALEQGADWLETPDVAAAIDTGAAAAWRSNAAEIRALLDGYWLENAGHYRSRVLESGRSAKELDIAVILSAIHCGPQSGSHSVHDPRQHATLARLDALFDARYPINRGRPDGRGVAMGRYDGDVYYSGGAYFFSTLGAAEFCFRAAIGARDTVQWIARGEAYLDAARAYTPDSGDLSEQFDQRDGQPRSARHLAWSYAAFISCVVARREALAAV
jgi:glucoamylase